MNNPLTRDLSIRIEKLRSLAEMVEETLVARAEALGADLEERAKDFPETQRAAFFESYAEDYVELADELPSILRYSVLTSADIALESYLNGTCATWAELTGARVGLRDLRGTGIYRARAYLKKVAGVPFPDQTGSWLDVLRLHELRNAVVHADGMVPSNTQLKDWAVSIKGLRITSWHSISLERPFSGAALDAFEAFGGEVDQACAGLGLWESVFPRQ